MSQKEEANMPLSCTFDFIDAFFHTSDHGPINRRTANHILHNKLADRKRTQKLIGRLAFYARIMPHGRSLLNSSYAYFTDVQNLQCDQDMFMITSEMHHVVKKIEKRIWNELLTEISSSPGHAFQDKEGPTSDTAVRVVRKPVSCQAINADGGSGVHFFGHVTGTNWTKQTLQLVLKKHIYIYSPGAAVSNSTRGVYRYTKTDTRSAQARSATRQQFGMAQRKHLGGIQTNHKVRPTNNVNICEEHKFCVCLQYIGSCNNEIVHTITRCN